MGVFLLHPLVGTPGQVCQRDIDGLLRSLNKTLSETQLAEIFTLVGSNYEQVADACL